MMKKFIAIAAVAALVLSLTACKNDTVSDSGSGAPDSSASESTPDISSAPDSNASDDVPETSDTESEPQEEIEEIPYTLGGELTPTMIANSRYNVGNQARLAAFFKKLQAGEEVTAAFLGGSITQGTSAGNDLCYARLTANWIQEQFPDATVNYVNAGIGATGSYIGVHRCDTDVLSQNPDIVFVDFSVNDTTERTELNKITYESLMRKLWFAESSPAIVTIAMTQDNGTSFQEYHGEVVKRYDIPMISYKNAILDVIDKGYIQWTDISDDNIHPNIPGHALLTDLITNYLQSVIDDLDNISAEESDFSQPTENGDKYLNAKLLTPADTEPASLGAFMVRDAAFGGFNGHWMLKSSEGQFTEDDGIEFRVTAKNIGLLYGKTVSNSVKADVYIDGELVATLDTDFSGGWGNYAEFAEIAALDSEGEHTLKIVPQSKDGAAAMYISAIAVS
ncbi:MAG: SGNH/GDSL hydrolase family protein [Oscillospiraceae bacterium]|nr:SGNH/GDSL hydrolase family protein [Oscillospiraceae bacterium]